MKLITWNVNGLRACIDKGLLDYLRAANADFISVQETKVNEPVKELLLQGYSAVWNHAEKLGYAGTVCLFRKKPVSVVCGLSGNDYDAEGRLITIEFKTFYLVNMYVPHSQGYIKKHRRLKWDVDFYNHILKLGEIKPIILCGDFNVTREYIDIYPENPRNIKNPSGFQSEERGWLDDLLETGLVDVFRELHPDVTDAYTWWSGIGNKRDENKGRRLDYFLASENLLPNIKSCEIRADVYGSDHAPVEMVVGLC